MKYKQAKNIIIENFQNKGWETSPATKHRDYFIASSAVAPKSFGGPERIITWDLKKDKEGASIDLELFEKQGKSFEKFGLMTTIFLDDFTDADEIKEEVDNVHEEVKQLGAK